jgi:hypothetical protein
MMSTTATAPAPGLGKSEQWRPGPDEVRSIVAELRPLIAALAERELARLRTIGASAASPS